MRIQIFFTVVLVSFFVKKRSVLCQDRMPISQSAEDALVVHTEKEIHDAVQKLRNGVRVILNTTNIELTRSLFIDERGVSIEGVRGKTTVRCPRGGDAPAIVIRGGGTKIAFLRLTGCRGRSAIVVEVERKIATRKTRIVFERVQFDENGDVEDDMVGAAVRIEACAETSCVRPLVRFEWCQFAKNQAKRGGAIFAQNADIRIHKCTFDRNEAALSGGAICTGDTHEGSLTISKSSFTYNKAHGSATKTASLEDDSLGFVANRTALSIGTGGALFASNPGRTVVSLSNFSDNVGCGGGGAIAVVHSPSSWYSSTSHLFDVEDSEFARNVAFCGQHSKALKMDSISRESNDGGALALEALDVALSVWSFRRTTFLSNQAYRGGAIRLRAKSPSLSQHTILSCHFDGNVALTGGGSVALASTQLSFENSVFRNSTSVYGGAFFAQSSILKSVRARGHDTANNTIENSTGMTGGGIYSSAGMHTRHDLSDIDARCVGALELEGLLLRNNTSYRSGGGIHVDGDSSSVILRGIVAEGNRAMVGGGAAFFGVPNIRVTSSDGQESIFRNNIAATGGGALYEVGEASLFLCTIENSSFIGNRAIPLADPEMAAFLEDSRRYHPPASVDATHVGSHSTAVDSVARSVEGNGGGLSVSFASLRPLTVVEVIFRNILLKENEAVVGGGVSAQMAELPWNEDRRHSCFPVAIGFDVCRHFAFQEVTVTGNRAMFAGGVFVSVPTGIVASCGADDEKRIPITRLRPSREGDDSRRFCTRIVGNAITDGDSRLGADVGTKAVRLEIEGWDGPLVPVDSGERLRVPCDGNASCTRPLRILVKDALNTTITRGIEDASLKLVLVSDAIVGDNAYTAVNGVVEISATRAWGINRTSVLTIASDYDRSVRVDVPISTRECYPGEIEHVDVCRSCPVGQYGFVATLGKCESCEDHAVCRGGAMLVPHDGFWHSGPFSPAFYKCIYPSACRYDGRQQKLEAFYEEATSLKTHLEKVVAYNEGQASRPTFPEYEQCAEGYTGPFCGSCQSGYGHSYTGKCAACSEGNGQSGFRMFLNAVWLFLLIGTNCAITWSSTNSRVTLAKHELQMAASNHPAPPTSVVAIHSSTQLPIASSERTGESLTALNSGTAESATVHRLVTTVLLTETLKILINYLQVTGIALRLQAKWSGPLKVLLQMEGCFVGSLATLVTAPFECSFDGTIVPASIAALWMRLVSPFAVGLSLILSGLFLYFYLRFQAAARTSNLPFQFTRKDFVTLTIVVSIVTMHFSYIDIVRELLRTINCVRKGEPQTEVRSDHPYLIYATEETGKRVWAEDTELTCFRQSHLPLAVVGIAGLILAFGGIVSIVLWLPLNRKHRTNALFLSRYWFLFQAYRCEWYTVCWEAVILTRKSLIAAAVVFTVHLTPTLNAALCAAILTASLALQAIFVPFKTPPNCQNLPEYAGGIFYVLRRPHLAREWLRFNSAIHLNMIESASLLSSALVFYCAVILQDAASSPLGRAFMSSFAFVTNSIFVFYVSYRLYAGLHLFLDLKQKTMHAPSVTTGKNSMGIFSLCFKLYGLFSDWRSRMDNQPINEDVACPAVPVYSLSVFLNKESSSV